MKRIIIAGTIALIAAVFVGTLVGYEHTMLALTSSSTEYQVVRVTAIGLLVALLFAHPPRSLEFRTILGAVSAVLSAGTAIMLESNQIGIFDAVIFIEVAIIFGLEAAEVTQPEKRPARKTVAAS